MTPTLVYQRGGRGRERVEETDQWRLLHDRPNPDQTAFAFTSDVTANVLGFGNAYIRKLYAGREVRELHVLDPTAVTPKRTKAGRVVYVDGSTGKPIERTRREIIHVRGFAAAG